MSKDRQYNPKFICGNEDCKRYNKVTYRIFSIDKPIICKSCGSQLKKFVNTIVEKRLAKAKQSYEKINNF